MDALNYCLTLAQHVNQKIGIARYHITQESSPSQAYWQGELAALMELEARLEADLDMLVDGEDDEDAAIFRERRGVTGVGIGEDLLVPTD